MIINLKLIKSTFVRILIFSILFITSVIYLFTTNIFFGDQTSFYNKKNLFAQSIYLDRIEYMNEACSKYKFVDYYYANNFRSEVFNHLIVDTKHRLLYCYVPKVACTNWKRLFMLLTGLTNLTDPLKIPANIAHSKSTLKTLNNYTTIEAAYFLKTFTKFLFVRNPFERLLSAYRNKLEYKNIKSDYFQVRFGKYIVKKYRNKINSNEDKNGTDVTFEEFTNYLINTTSKSLNEHWKPIYSLCEPCRIKYDFIGKYETLYTDSDFILKNIGADNLKFPHSIKTSGTSKELKKYFSNLSPKKISSLYKFYEIDFKLFQYNLQDLLGYELS